MKKKLSLSANKVVCGVCGGIGEFINVNPVFVRLGFVLIFLICKRWEIPTGIYLVLLAVMPKQRKEDEYEDVEYREIKDEEE